MTEAGDSNTVQMQLFGGFSQRIYSWLVKLDNAFLSKLQAAISLIHRTPEITSLNGILKLQNGMLLFRDANCYPSITICKASGDLIEAHVFSNH